MTHTLIHKHLHKYKLPTHLHIRLVHLHTHSFVHKPSLTVFQCSVCNTEHAAGSGQTQRHKSHSEYANESQDLDHGGRSSHACLTFMSVHWRQLGGEALPHTLTRFPGSQTVQVNHRQRVTPAGLWNWSTMLKIYGNPELTWFTMWIVGVYTTTTHTHVYVYYYLTSQQDKGRQ